MPDTTPTAAPAADTTLDPTQPATTPIYADKKFIAMVCGIITMLIAKLLGVNVSPDTLAELITVLVSVYTVIHGAKSTMISVANAKSVGQVAAAQVAAQAKTNAATAADALKP